MHDEKKYGIKVQEAYQLISYNIEKGFIVCNICIYHTSDYYFSSN